MNREEGKEEEEGISAKTINGKGENETENKGGKRKE